MNQSCKYGLLLLCAFLLASSIVPQVKAEDTSIVLDFYYSESCGTCEEFKQLITDEFKNNEAYDDFLSVHIKNVDTDMYYDEWEDEYDFYPYPFVVISSPYQKTSEIGEFEVSISHLEEIIDEFKFSSKIIPVVNSSMVLNADLYYTANCSNCDVYISSFTRIEQNFSDNFSFHPKNIQTNEQYFEEYESFLEEENSSFRVPFMVLQNNDSVLHIVKEENISDSSTYISNVLHEFVKKTNPRPKNENIIYTPFGTIDISAWSLPMLTVILGGIDSFNPCAFFILIFLLNLLIYAKSRKRMLLIGGIFIFFSGLLYMIFMFFLYGLLFQLKSHMVLFTIIVGAIVIPMGLLNIKDFFYFKKGASLSIPDSKKPKIYKKMRGLVKHPKLSATILGTVMLAVTVNFYELLCTLGLPLAFTSALSENSVVSESAAYYVYILLYNIVYVIPLFIILLVFVVTLGKRKLSEWHGQVMKLVSGLMLSSFGFIFLIDYQLLENPVTPVILLAMSLGVTAVITWVYKKYVGIPSETDEE